MSAEDLEKYETEMELTLYREYRDVVGIFKYVVETDRRFYLCNQVDVKARTEAGDVFFEVSMSDAWVWDMYRPARFAKNVKVLTFKDVNVEELSPSEIDPPKVPDPEPTFSSTGAPPRRYPQASPRGPVLTSRRPRRWRPGGRRDDDRQRQRSSRRSGRTASPWRRDTWWSRGWSCSTATGAATRVRSTWCCATATCWWSARSRPAAALRYGTPHEAVDRHQGRPAATAGRPGG